MRSNLLDVGQWPRLVRMGMTECARLAAAPRPLAAGQVTVALTGSLGDQLFQFAAGYSLARKLGYGLRLDLTLVRAFGVPRVLPVELDLPARIHGRWGSAAIRGAIKSGWPAAPRVLCQDAELERVLDAPKPAQRTSFYLDGHWQNPTLFAEDRAELRRLFLPLDAEPRQQSSKIQAASQPCAVCLQRPVYQVQNGGPVWSDEMYLSYVKAAIEAIKQDAPDAHFFIFPADAWSKSKIPDLIDSMPHDTIDDFDENSVGYVRLLMSCRSFVLASSSLAWWGAWLADATLPVIAPRRWFPLSEQLSRLVIPMDWRRL